MQMDLPLQYHNHILNEREKCKEEAVKTKILHKSKRKSKQIEKKKKKKKANQ